MLSLSLPARSLLLTAAAALCLLVLGCDNTIDPFSEDGSFSLYGYLSTTSDRQVVRVKDLRSPFTREATRTLDATVTLENLTTGTAITLTDSVRDFDDVFAHNFWTDLSVTPNTSYRLTVERSDGTTTRAETTTPSVISPEAHPASGHCLQQFTVIFPGVRQLQRIRPSIGFLPKGEEPNDDDGNPLDDDRDTGDRNDDAGLVWVQNGERSVQTFGGTSADVRVTFIPETVLAAKIPSVDNPLTRFEYEPRCWELAERRIYVAYTHLGPTWFGNTPDSLVVFDPTETRFVENGLGFFGALRRDTASVLVDTSGVITITP